MLKRRADHRAPPQPAVRHNVFLGSNNGALGEGAARLLVDESSPVFAGCPGWTGDAVRRLSTLVREATLRDGQRSAVLEGCERAETQTRMRAGRPLSTWQLCNGGVWQSGEEESGPTCRVSGVPRRAWVDAQQSGEERPRKAAKTHPEERSDRSTLHPRSIR